MAGEKLVHIMQKAACGMNPESAKTDMLQGVVTSVNPLKVMISKGEKDFELTKDFLIRSPLCYETKTEDGNLLWRGLKTKDKVVMLRVANGNKYYIMHREGRL